MKAGDILKQVEGLTSDKLTYFVRARYVKPRKKKRGTLKYNIFTEKDLQLIKQAWHYIESVEMKTSSAFKKAKEDINNPQKKLFE